MDRVAIAFVLASFLMAGCVDSSQAVPSPGFAEVGGGILEVLVADDALQPIQNVTVSITELGRTTNTSEAGLARFEQVPAGTYRVAGERDGYVASEAMADVVAEETAHAKLLLVALPSTKAYSETILGKIFIGCTFNINDGMIRGSTGCGDSNHKTNVTLKFAPNWTQMVAEAEWSTGGLSSNPEYKMSLYYLTPVAQSVSLIHTYADVPGPSPIKVVLLAATNHTELGADTITPGPEGGPLNVTMWKQPMDVAGLKPFGISFQQPMDLFFTTFFFAPNPDVEQFSARPDN